MMVPERHPVSPRGSVAGKLTVTRFNCGFCCFGDDRRQANNQVSNHNSASFGNFTPAAAFPAVQPLVPCVLQLATATTDSVVTAGVHTVAITSGCAVSQVVVWQPERGFTTSLPLLQQPVRTRFHSGGTGTSPAGCTCTLPVCAVICTSCDANFADLLHQRPVPGDACCWSRHYDCWITSP